MNSLEYSYVLIKYCHDRSAGEVLNAAVVMYCPESGQLGFRYSTKFGRLSETFANFDGDLYRRTMNRLERTLESLSVRMTTGLFDLEERERFPDVASVMRAIWPDQGMAYYTSVPAHGMTSNVDEELRDLFDRFIVSQYDSRDSVARYDDEAVWGSVRKLLTAPGVVNALQAKTLGPAEVEFPHAWKNNKWHVIEPVSLDYASASDMKDRALVTVGKAAAVRSVEDLGSFTVIVSRPKRIEATKQYEEAIRLLRDLPLDKREIIMEEDIDRYALRLQDQITAHLSLELARLK